MRRVHGTKVLDESARKRLESLASTSDAAIDTSDIPEWTEKEFAQAVPFHKLYKPRKEQITARIDADVLAWLKSFGKGYQTLMNELLRKEMMEAMKQKG